MNRRTDLTLGTLLGFFASTLVWVWVERKRSLISNEAMMYLALRDHIEDAESEAYWEEWDEDE